MTAPGEGVSLDAEALAARLSEATPGGWKACLDSEGGFCIYGPRAAAPGEQFVDDEEPIAVIAERVGSKDADLILLAPALAREVLQLRAEAEALRADRQRLRELAEAVNAPKTDGASLLVDMTLLVSAALKAQP